MTPLTGLRITDTDDAKLLGIILGYFKYPVTSIIEFPYSSATAGIITSS